MVDLTGLYDKTEYEDYFDQSFYDKRELSYREISRAVILPAKKEEEWRDYHGGVLDGEGKFIENTGIYFGLSYPYEYETYEETFIDEEVIYLGMFYNHWGHFITDLIRRVWFIKSDLRKQFHGVKCVYTADRSFKFDGVLREFFDILGIRYYGWKRVDNISRYRKVILPDECFYNDRRGRRFFTKEYMELIDQVRLYADEHSRPTGMDKVYFTYGLYRRDKLYGEKKLEEFFCRKGYHIILPYMYSLKDRLNIMRNCTCFAATEGTDSHNIIFLKEKSDIIIIPRGAYINPYQASLNQVQEQNVYYIDSSLSIFNSIKHRWDGPFYFFVSEKLLEFFGDLSLTDEYYIKTQFYDFRDYFREGVRRNPENIFDIPAYYQKSATDYIRKMIDAKGK